MLNSHIYEKDSIILTHHFLTTGTTFPCPPYAKYSYPISNSLFTVNINVPP
jgi:hypothetical protein